MTKGSDPEFAHTVIEITVHSNKSYLRESHRNMEGCHIKVKKQDTIYTQIDKVQNQKNFINTYSLGIYKVVGKLKKKKTRGNDYLSLYGRACEGLLGKFHLSGK